MAPAAKRRRVVSTFEASKAVSVVIPTTLKTKAKTGSIASFGRISKSAGPAATTTTVKGEKNKLVEANINVLNGLFSGKSNIAAAAAGTKRKPDDDLRSPHKKAVKTEQGEACIKLEGDENAAPSLPTIVEIAAPDTPTKAARTRFESLKIRSSPVKNESFSFKPSHSPLSTSSSQPHPSQSSSSPSIPTPCPKKRRRADDGGGSDSLPEPVQEFLELHSAFVTALSLHYAHHGTATPVDIRQLGPSVAKVWGRRAVSTDDVRRLLGVQQRSVGDAAQAALLSVWDYGRGKTCIEYCQPPEDPAAGNKKAWGYGVARQPLESANLVRSFGVYLREQYAAFVTAEGEDADSSDFVVNLPLARLHKRAAGKAAKSALVSKGQARLTELKNGAITRYTKDASKDTLSLSQQTLASTPSSSLGTASSSLLSSSPSAPLQQPQQTLSKALPPSKRTDSLLSRIRAKETLLASQPAGPSTEQLARRAALQRAPDVIGVLTVLASNSGRSAGAGAGMSSVARSGIVSSSSPLAMRMSSVSLGSRANTYQGGNSNSRNGSGSSSGNGSSDEDDALLAALGGSGSTSRPTSSSARGLAGMFGSSSPVGSSSNQQHQVQEQQQRQQQQQRSPLSSPSSSSSSSSTSQRSPLSLVGTASAPSAAAAAVLLSMSMAQVVERVQHSLRAPVAAAELEQVLHLVAAEVAPHWLQVRQVGSVRACTIRGSAGPARGWRERVAELLACS